MGAQRSLDITHGASLGLRFRIRATTGRVAVGPGVLLRQQVPRQRDRRSHAQESAKGKKRHCQVRVMISLRGAARRGEVWDRLISLDARPAER